LERGCSVPAGELPGVGGHVLATECRATGRLQRSGAQQRHGGGPVGVRRDEIDRASYGADVCEHNPFRPVGRAYCKLVEVRQTRTGEVQQLRAGRGGVGKGQQAVVLRLD
jgi:hypothetical protein